MKKTNILCALFGTFIIVSYLLYNSHSTKSAVRINNKFGNMDNVQFDFYYSDYNNVFKYKNNGNDNVIAYNDKYSLYGGIIINDKLLETIQDYYDYEIVDIFNNWGQPVFSNENIILFDGWPIERKCFTIYCIENNSVLEIEKELHDEILVDVQTIDESINLLTDCGLYLIDGEKVESHKYLYNSKYAEAIFDNCIRDFKEYKVYEDIILYSEEFFNLSSDEQEYDKYNSKISLINNGNRVEKLIENYILMDIFLKDNYVYCIGFEKDLNNSVTLYKYDLFLNEEDSKCIKLSEYVGENIFLSSYDESISIHEGYMYYLPFGMNNNMFMIKFDLNTLEIVNIKEILLEEGYVIMEYNII